MDCEIYSPLDSFNVIAVTFPFISHDRLLKSLIHINAIGLPMDEVGGETWT